MCRMASAEEVKGEEEIAPGKPKKTAKQRILEQVTSLSPEDDERAAASKKISWILRHGARKVALKPDEEGFVTVADLAKVEILDDLSEEKLMALIEVSNAQKLRYEIKDSPEGKLIKALSKDARKPKKDETAPKVARSISLASEVDAPAKPKKFKEPPKMSMRAEAQVFVPAAAPAAVPSPYAAPAPPPAPYGGYPYPYAMPPQTPGSPMGAYPFGYPGFGMMPPTPQAGMAPPPPPGKFRGRIKSFNTDKGFGFIDCPEAQAQFGRDVFLHKANVGDMTVGTEVMFSVESNKQGMPQARDLVTIAGGVPAGAVDGRQKGKGKGKGKTDGKGKDKGKGKGKDKGKTKEQKDSAADAAPEEKQEEKKEEKKDEA